MTNEQLYIAIGIPSALFTVNLLVLLGGFFWQNKRFEDMRLWIDAKLETVNVRLDAIERRLDVLETRVSKLEEQGNSLLRR